MALTHFTKETFEAQITNGKGLALVDFWASWCGPCKMLAPTIDQLAEELPETLIGKVDIEEQPIVADEFDVKSIPTLILFRDGMEIARKVGVQSKQALLDMIKEA